MELTKGQLSYEWKHYLQKMLKRNQSLYDHYKLLESISPHPMFTLVEGGIELWEKV